MPVSLAKPALPARAPRTVASFAPPVARVAYAPSPATVARRAKAQARLARAARAWRIACTCETVCNALGLAGGALAALVMLSAVAMAWGVLSPALVPYAVTASIGAAGLGVAYMLAGLAHGVALALYNRARR